MNRIVIIIEGGIVQGAVAEDPENLDIDIAVLEYEKGIPDDEGRLITQHPRTDQVRAWVSHPCISKSPIDLDEIFSNEEEK